MALVDATAAHERHLVVAHHLFLVDAEKSLQQIGERACAVGSADAVEDNRIVARFQELGEGESHGRTSARRIEAAVACPHRIMAPVDVFAERGDKHLEALAVVAEVDVCLHPDKVIQKRKIRSRHSCLARFGRIALDQPKKVLVQSLPGLDFRRVSGPEGARGPDTGSFKLPLLVELHDLVIRPVHVVRVFIEASRAEDEPLLYATTVKPDAAADVSGVLDAVQRDYARGPVFGAERDRRLLACRRDLELPAPCNLQPARYGKRVARLRPLVEDLSVGQPRDLHRRRTGGAAPFELDGLGRRLAALQALPFLGVLGIVICRAALARHVEKRLLRRPKLLHRLTLLGRHDFKRRKRREQGQGSYRCNNSLPNVHVGLLSTTE